MGIDFIASADATSDETEPGDNDPHRDGECRSSIKFMDDEEYMKVTDALERRTAERLRIARGSAAQTEAEILAYLTEGYRLNLTGGELTDFFCVSTPNIVESAGYVGAEVDPIVAKFDELHDRFLATRSSR